MKKFSVLSVVALCIGMLMVSSCGWLPFGEQAKWRKFYKEDAPVIDYLVRETMRAALKRDYKYFRDEDKIEQTSREAIVEALDPVFMAHKQLHENVYMGNLDIDLVWGGDSSFDNARLYVYVFSPTSDGKHYVRYNVKVYKDLNDQWKITGIELKTVPTKEQN